MSQWWVNDKLVWLTDHGTIGTVDDTQQKEEDDIIIMEKKKTKTNVGRAVLQLQLQVLLYLLDRHSYTASHLDSCSRWHCRRRPLLSTAVFNIVFIVVIGWKACCRLESSFTCKIHYFKKNANKAVDVLLSKCCEVSLEVPTARVRSTQKAAGITA